MTSVLVYGGYHNYYFYANHLSDSIALELRASSASIVCKPPITIFNSLFHYIPKLDFNINQRILDCIKNNNITHVFNFNTNHFSRDLLERFKSMGIKVAFYSNDSLYSRDFRKRLYYKQFHRTCDLYDWIFFYRYYDLEYFRLTHNFANGRSINSSIFLPSCPSSCDISKMPSLKNKLYDFSFVGHYENDGRIVFIKKLLQYGYSVFVAGPSWPSLAHPNLELLRNSLSYSEYLHHICLAKVHIGFTSFKNRDLYTRRYFEIPFTRSILLARFSPLYESLSSDLSRISWFYDHVPNLSEAHQALQLFYELEDSDCSEELGLFYSSNCMVSRLSSLHNFLGIVR